MVHERTVKKYGLIQTGLLASVLVIQTTGCSIKRLAITQLADTLSAGGSTFASEDDPELVRAAAPFSLKLVESLIEEAPSHPGLLLAAVSGFTQFSYAFVQQEADRLEEEDINRSETLRYRARKLYLRARDYGLRGLEVAHPGFSGWLRENAAEAVLRVGPEQVPLLYWTASAWGGAIAVSKDDPDLIADQVQVEALIDRALSLNETYAHGAIHSLLISYEMVRQGGVGNAAQRAKAHFERAVALSHGNLAGPFVAYAESVMIQKQDSKQFESLLRQALAIDPNAILEERLANLVFQDRAKWLLSRMDELFLLPDSL